MISCDFIGNCIISFSSPVCLVSVVPLQVFVPVCEPVYTGVPVTFSKGRIPATMFTRTVLLLCVGCRLVAGVPADAGNGISDRFFLPFLDKVFEDKEQVINIDTR